MGDLEAEEPTGDLAAAVQADLDRWGPEIAGSALAAAALDAARRLDRPKVTDASASLLHGQLRQYLSDLRKLAPEAESSDEVDEVAAQREARRRAAGMT